MRKAPLLHQPKLPRTDRKAAMAIAFIGLLVVFLNSTASPARSAAPFDITLTAAQWLTMTSPAGSQVGWRLLQTYKLKNDTGRLISNLYLTSCVYGGSSAVISKPGINGYLPVVPISPQHPLYITFPASLQVGIGQSVSFSVEYDYPGGSSNAKPLPSGKKQPFKAVLVSSYGTYTLSLPDVPVP